MKACRTFIPATGKGAITEKVTGRGILGVPGAQGHGYRGGVLRCPGSACGGRAGARVPGSAAGNFMGPGKGPLVSREHWSRCHVADMHLSVTHVADTIGWGTHETHSCAWGTWLCAQTWHVHAHVPNTCHRYAYVQQTCYTCRCAGDLRGHAHRHAHVQ